MKCSAIAGVTTGCINPVLPGATILLNVLLGDCLLSWAMHGGSSFGSYVPTLFPMGIACPQTQFLLSLNVHLDVFPSLKTPLLALQPSRLTPSNLCISILS